MIRKAKRAFEKGIAHKSKRNPKLFWSHIRSKLKTKIGVAPLLKDPKDKASMRFDDEEKANILQDHFSSVFTRESGGNTPTVKKKTDSTIHSIAITTDMVREEIKNLNINKSCGPDEVHPR